MELEICEEFYYRIQNNNEDIYSIFNTSKENVVRNNDKIKLYSGEWIKIKVNDYQTHIVKPAENLCFIANRYGITEQELIQQNNLKSTKLFIGQQLKINKKTTKF